MGKKSGTSWLTIVKRAFRSPSKDGDRKSSRRREEHEQEEEEKKREKRRWLFRKHSNIVQVLQQQQQQPQQQCEEKVANTCTSIATPLSPILGAHQRHAMAVAAATAAAAEAAAATAQAAAEIVRLTRPSSFVREQRAAVLIQTAFRGYLARRALRALRGLVKLQALVRGQNVRKQAKLTLKCMQALVRVQDRIRYQRARLSHEGSRKSMLSEINVDLWESKYLQDIRERKPMSRDVSSALDDWDDRLRAIEDVEAIIGQGRKEAEAALKREKALAYAFSSQIWRSRRNPSLGGDEEELEEDRSKWLDRGMATNKQWDNSSRASTSDRRDTNIKTVEVDTIPSRPYYASYQYQTATATPRTSMQYCHPNHQHIKPQPTNSPITPPSATSCRPRPLQVRSASPRCLREEKCCYSAAHTPSFGYRTSYVAGGRCHGMGAIPNYMAATESAKAKARSQSAPRQRPSTPERERGSGGGGGSVARKRLSYPVPPDGNIGRSSFSQNLRSPSFKSVCNGYVGMELRSNYSSCYTESVGGGEISPSSTTDLRWLK